ncbi:hypothetical protein AWRIB429_2072 [Oenococcus oeni AWRIB429]|uniref:Uncharacterized protein n=1 Tax=Oenococcus oeni AWRIB429 TaxID=655225 RepID=D3LCJ2_OENOE|nr:hypothetical protein AWRIB429_2072 [Oenococcus oeni AWRIB429]
MIGVNTLKKERMTSFPNFLNSFFAFISNVRSEHLLYYAPKH